jgi:hypothetical protein
VGANTVKGFKQNKLGTLFYLHKICTGIIKKSVRYLRGDLN